MSSRNADNLSRRLGLPAIAAAALLLAPAIAHAQSDADRATARELAKAGEQALASQDYTKAADLYARADSLVHAPTLLLQLAHAQIGLGKLVAAQENLARIVREGAAAGAPPAFAKAVEVARKELADLQPRVPGVVIQVTPASATGVVVTLDDVAVPAAALGVKRLVNPGKHLVRAKADGFEPADASFTVAEGATESVSLALKAGAAPPVVVVAPPPPAAEPAPTKPGAPSEGPAPSSTQKVLAFVAMGIGVAGLGVGGVTGGLAFGKHTDAVSACKDNGPTCGSTKSAYETTATISTISFIGGGAFAAGGVVLLLTAPSRKPTPSAWIAPRVGPGYVGLEGSF